MPSRRRRSGLVLFSSEDPQPLVNWLCETYGLSTILQSVAQYQPPAAAAQAPAKRAYKKRGRKRGGAKKGGAKSSAAKKGGAKRGRPRRKQSEAGAEQGQ